MSDDSELLRRYAEEKDEGAFAELVRRYVDLIYSAAMRQVHDAHLAEDVTQTVFLKLSRKAEVLPESVVLAGWLHADTRFAALELLRKERRRVAREATQMEPNNERSEWHELGPVIDEVLGKLEPDDRDAVVLRFFGGRSFADVGEALRVGPDAARMRVNRSLEKLREALESRGIKTTAAALSAALLANAIQAAPGNLAKRATAFGAKTAVAAAPIWTSRGLIGILSGGTAALILFLILSGAPKAPPKTSAGTTAKAAGDSAVPSLSAAQAPASTVSGDPTPTKALKLKIVESAERKPLENVEVKLRNYTHLRPPKNETFKSDAEGTVELAFPTDTENDFHFQLHLSKDGYVPRYVSWSKFQRDEFAEIPEEYTATMDRGVEIGGWVRDLNERPLGDVKVVFSGPSQSGAPPRERDTIMGDFHTETTDAYGRWRCNHVRADFRSLTFRLEHPFYQTVTYGSKETAEPFIGPKLLPNADFVAARADMRMQPGLIIRGTVLDENGAPIEGATITRQHDWNYRASKRTSDASGQFSFTDAEPAEFLLTAEAKGFAPVFKKIRFDGPETNLPIRLERSVGLSAIVTDEAGKRILRARVSTTDMKKFQWSGSTDENGVFLWDSSPNEPAELQINAHGYVPMKEVIRPGEAGRVLVLASNDTKKSLLTIRVFDAATKQALNSAMIFVEEHRDGGVSPFHEGRPALNGVYRFLESASEAAFVFEARAPGYTPARTERIRFTGPKEVELALSKSDLISGSILGPDGSPVSGAQVALCTGERGAMLSAERQLLYTDQSHVVRSDANGKFEHPQQIGAHSIYVISDAGFAGLRLTAWQNGGVIQLKPWGRISGVASINGKIAKNIELVLFDMALNGNERWLSLHSFNATTDAEGRFIFENVPPIELKLGWLRPYSQGKQFSHSLPIAVSPGGTTEVNFALNGKTVRGRFKFDATNEVDWLTQIGMLIFGPRMEEPSYNRFRSDPEMLKKAYTEFWVSEEGRAWGRKQRSFTPEVHKDGTFEIPSVPAGEFILQINLREKSEDQFRSKILGMAEKDVVIPEDDDEVDLGEILLQARR